MMTTFTEPTQSMLDHIINLEDRNAELLEALEAVADDDTYINYYVQEIVERAIRKASR